MRYVDLSDLEVVEETILNSGAGTVPCWPPGGYVCGLGCSGGNICGLWCSV